MFNIGDNHEGDILNITVVGELMSNSHFCENETRGLAGRWLIFVSYSWSQGGNQEEGFKKVIENGFKVRRRDKNDQIKLLLNMKLADPFNA